MTTRHSLPAGPTDRGPTSASAPLYEKVKRYITDAIGTGEFLPGQKLPSESRLVASLDVSRMTVSRALRELKHDGVITRRQGVGSFVSELGPTTSLIDLRDIKDTIVEQGQAYSCRVLQAERTLVEESVGALLELESDVPVIHIVLLHCSDAQPMQLERRFVRADFAPGLLGRDLTRTSLFAYLQSLSPVSELEQVVEACLPDESECASLGVGTGQPVLRIRRRTWVGSRIVTLGYFSHPGDRYRVTARIRPASTGP